MTDNENIIDQIKPDIIDILATKPEARKDLIKWIKDEFGFNAEPYFEKYFDELPDKKSRIEELDVPMKDIAESVFDMLDEGYSNAQIAYQLRLWPAQIKRIVDDRSGWEKRLQKVAMKGLPWHVRTVLKIKNWVS